MAKDVIVVGAGPVGLMLAGELRLGGVDVVVYETMSAPSGESRGVGFSRRAAEVFHQRGLLSRLGDFQWGNQGHYGGVRIDFGALEDNHFGVRGVAQSRVEEVLEAWVRELGGDVRRAHEVVDLWQTDDEVVVEVDGPNGRVRERARYLVGCDGGRSGVRKRVGIDFPGWPATRGMYLADVVGCDIDSRHIGERVPGGMVLSVNLEEGVDRIIIHEDGLRPVDDKGTLTFDRIADSWQRLTGQDLHGAECRWLSAFTDTTRQAAEYRRGRVFLAGDSAHIHIPAGAQGLSVGVQDAVNLGWKLAADLHGWGVDGLLDTYHAERHPVGELLLRNSRAQSLLYLTGDEMDPLRSLMNDLVRLPQTAEHLAGMVSGLSIRYDVGTTGHPLLGLRMPELPLDLPDGSRTDVFTLLHPARGVLVSTAGSAEVAAVAAGWADRVDLVTGSWAAAGPGDGPTAPDAVLLRPDGHVVWATPSDGDLAQALRRWFGPPGARATRSRPTDTGAVPVPVQVP